MSEAKPNPVSVGDRVTAAAHCGHGDAVGRVVEVSPSGWTATVEWPAGVLRYRDRGVYGTSALRRVP